MSRALRVLFGFLMLAALAPVLPVQAAGASMPALPAGCTVSGVPGSPLPVLNGSQILVCVPPSGWNGDAVIFAHGYVSPTVAAGTIPWDQLVLPDQTTTLPGLVMSQGYAFAATSYPVNGLVIGKNNRQKPVNLGVQAVVDLARYLKKSVRGLQRIYLTGASEGGLVTALAVEQYPAVFSAGLATCGPIGDFNAQTNYLGDFRMVFDYFYPGILSAIYPGQTTPRIPDNLVTDANGAAVGYAVGNAVASNPSKTAQLFNVTHVAVDPTVPATTIDSAVQVQWYNFFATDDAMDKLGGNPYDNQSRQYSGSINDALLNSQVQRYSADPAALKVVSSLLQTSGRLQRPLVTMHTLLDPVVPYWHEPLYTQKVLLSGSWFERVNIPILRYGHCAFQPAEVLAAFGVMVTMATGQGFSWQDVQAALPDQAAQQEYRDLQGKYQRGEFNTQPGKN